MPGEKTTVPLLPHALIWFPTNLLDMDCSSLQFSRQHAFFPLVYVDGMTKSVDQRNNWSTMGEQTPSARVRQGSRVIFTGDD